MAICCIAVSNFIILASIVMLALTGFLLQRTLRRHSERIASLERSMDELLKFAPIPLDAIEDDDGDEDDDIIFEEDDDIIVEEEDDDVEEIPTPTPKQQLQLVPDECTPVVCLVTDLAAEDLSGASSSSVKRRGGSRQSGK